MMKSQIVRALAPAALFVVASACGPKSTGEQAEAGEHAGEEKEGEHAEGVVELSPQQIAEYFEGLEPVAPGVVPCPEWRPDVAPLGEPVRVDAYGGVARKP